MWTGSDQQHNIGCNCSKYINYISVHSVRSDFNSVSIRLFCSLHGWALRLSSCQESWVIEFTSAQVLVHQHLILWQVLISALVSQHQVTWSICRVARMCRAQLASLLRTETDHNLGLGLVWTPQSGTLKSSSSFCSSQSINFSDSWALPVNSHP